MNQSVIVRFLHFEIIKTKEIIPKLESASTDFVCDVLLINVIVYFKKTSVTVADRRAA